VIGAVKRHVCRAVTVSRPTRDEFSLPGIELIDSVRTRVANEKKPVLVHCDFAEVAWTASWGNHVGDELVVSGSGLGLQDAHAFVSIESCILSAIAKIDGVGRGVVEKTVRMGSTLKS
jgi:hypothetical protein